MTHKWLTKHSKAKLNLFLHIIGRKNNGLHLIESFFVLLHELYDIIKVRNSNSSQCTVVGQNIHGKNIAITTLEAMQHFAPSMSVEIEIQKQIPIGAGLGGGSSNAATLMILLNQLWNLNLTVPQLQQIATSIGADVPFFLHQDNAFVSNTGETITHCQIGISSHMLVVYPMFPISTKDVYQISVQSFRQPLSQLSKVNLIEAIVRGQNDLQQAAIRLEPQLTDLIDYMSKQEGVITTSMSGSGSACFSSFQNKEKATLALQRLRNKYPRFFLHYEEISI
ncbi:4-(cytidine 5'-diphospho)-2-C-methyl-D-erythritol kinase [Rickettsiales endosymbiont of Peranema trichophorum]|uniref:4-(cytidine 5'-diphospho)-2-C-methyl-D-erythritol kinase n=1 Tax=Rickettsiales endosymbiont of Peranema trichophorum TaxID=2486577 RepID=UPI001022CE39|nr:4-(cytidine 5'-diphospho)-2-C-methyl-D-erythritol kinase [Rickettsiales endosymbiont of Peranema trichophorum]RZI46021.1 4-(cytidine 5'-diphospho)-2-C-methyl-D-erythritol kinase [Rickettsiales endosymbiont of Peranema trichophorum]